jgi:hypothetical protein
VATQLETDLERLSALAYHRLQGSGDLARRFHRLGKSVKPNPDFWRLEQVYRWLFVPITLWPIDLEGLFRAVLVRVESGKRLSKSMTLLLDLLPPLPAAATQVAVSQHEHAVQKGDYEPLVQAQHKFDDIEAELARDPAFKADWRAIRARFDVKQFQNHKRIIRRRLVSERSMRDGWTFRGASPAGLFREVFDVFCQRWNLYGMRGDQPLLTKLTVNLSPFGTIIFVPAFWSFDAKRDVNWRAITALHRARGVPKQGRKRTAAQTAQYEEAERARLLWAEAGALGLKGEPRSAWVMQKLGWDSRTDERTLRRLRACRRAK